MFTYELNQAYYVYLPSSFSRIFLFLLHISFKIIMFIFRVHFSRILFRFSTSLRRIICMYVNMNNFEPVLFIMYLESRIFFKVSLLRHYNIILVLSKLYISCVMQGRRLKTAAEFLKCRRPIYFMSLYSCFLLHVFSSEQNNI